MQNLLARMKNFCVQSLVTLTFWEKSKLIVSPIIHFVSVTKEFLTVAILVETFVNKSSVGYIYGGRYFKVGMFKNKYQSDNSLFCLKFVNIFLHNGYTF